MQKKQPVSSSPFFDYSGPLEKAIDIAHFYGFDLIKPIAISGQDEKTAKMFDEAQEDPHATGAGNFILNTKERVAFLRTFFDNNFDSLPRPVQLMHISDGSTPRSKRLTLEILGTNKPISDSILVHTCNIIINKILKKEGCLHINTVGDKESVSAYQRELKNYYRKNINNATAFARKLIHKDVYRAISTKDERVGDIGEQAPRSLTTLSELSRERFKENIEFLEALSMRYMIDHTVLGHPTYSTETQFDVHIFDKETEDSCSGFTIASGGRTDSLSQKIDPKRKMSLASMTIEFSGVGKTEKYTPLKKSKKEPDVFYIQLGYDAKIRSLQILEMLRLGHIHVKHAIMRDGLGPQLLFAEKLHIPLMILMGQKEVIEKSVIVREIETRRQETVPVDKLIDYLKNK